MGKFLISLMIFEEFDFKGCSHEFFVDVRIKKSKNKEF
jgi:hypothetical protein